MARTEIQGVKIPFTSYFLPKIGSCVGLLNFINKCGSGEWRTDCDMADQSLTYRAVIERGGFEVADRFIIGATSFDGTINHFEVVALSDVLLFVVDYRLGGDQFEDLSEDRKAKTIDEYNRLTKHFCVADVCPDVYDLWDCLSE